MIELDLPENRVHALTGVLSQDELARAGRFRFERDRRRFICGRGALRVVPGRYLGMDPHDLIFQYSERGKPSLAAVTDIVFNLTHSGDFAVCAVGRCLRLGIDVEAFRPVAEMEHVARDYFSTGEFRSWMAVPEEQRLDAFFTCWTRKEAYLKATGEGISVPPGSFEVALDRHQPRILAISDDIKEAERWQMIDLLPRPGYCGALAVEGCGWTVAYESWA